MFPSAKTRITTAARRGFDLALEFATLGEYRLAEPHEADGPTGVRPRSGRARSRSVSAFAEPVLVAGGVGAGAPAPARPRASRVGPATAAARRLQPPTAAPAPARRPTVVPRRVQPAAPLARISARAALRGIALEASNAASLRGSRKRSGAAPPRPQPCLVADPPRTP